MILAFDVGNSETTVALFEGERERAHWRLVTDAKRTHDELGALLHSLVAGSGIELKSIEGAALASVVPAVTAPLSAAAKRWLGVEPRIIDGKSPLPITLEVDEPMTVGADRIANTLAAKELIGGDVVVVDLGTATTFDCVTKDGAFIGGAISPGIRTAADMLTLKTAKLPATELVAPKRAIGTRTEECIQAGVVLYNADAIDGMVARVRAEWPGGRRPVCVATGGLAPMFQRLCKSFDRVEPLLTLHGIRLAYGYMAGPSRSPAPRGPRGPKRK